MGLQRFRDARGGAFASGNGVDNFASAIYAIASCKIFRICSCAGFGIYHDAAVFQFNAFAARKKIDETRLADGRDDHVAGNCEIRVWNWREIFIYADAFDAFD